MGHLHHQPEMTGPIGADHFVVVLDVNDERVLVHDPHGYPYAEVPVADFLTAWRAETIDYGTAYTMRTGFTKVADVTAADAVRASIPAAIEWLSMRADRPVPPGSLGNAAAAARTAELVEAGAVNGLRGTSCTSRSGSARAGWATPPTACCWPATPRRPASRRRRPGSWARCSTRW